MIYNFDSLSFQIVTIDRFKHREGFFSVNARPYSALSFRVSGTGDFKFGDKRLLVNPGDILFIPSDLPYEVEYSLSESIVIHMKDCNYYEPEAYSLENSAEVSLLFMQICQDWQRWRSVNGAKAAIYSIFEKIEKDKNLSISNTAFAGCLRYIETNFCEASLDIGAVCKEGFISVSSLQRMFLQYFGVSPMQYVIKLRMNKALGLLVANKHSVREISSMCGFSDEKYFSRAFKKKYGVPPSRFKNNMML
ncbi:MAG: helix-turn-helix domain-containing protein [Ruminococcaceae bacterium]|nr:helix-turn-helix domain-containing protein [Oscillospiraceae bacterium]